jgi:tRNA(Ile)-lysidine synthase
MCVYGQKFEQYAVVEIVSTLRGWDCYYKDPDLSLKVSLHMQTSFERGILTVIRRARLLEPGDRVALAVSGGADSTALLRLFVSLQHDLGITLLVAHFDHTLRGAQSEADAQFVAALARDHSLPYIGEREDVAAVAARDRLNLEDAARRLRYGFFQRIVEQGYCTRVAVAHTADDQAETVMARLFRGTGPSGLAGIYPRLGAIVRPLLGIRRQALRGYLHGLGQPWREDFTNSDRTRQRVKIRRELLPLIETDFSPGIVAHLSELARLSREEQEFWKVLVHDRFRALVRADGGRFVVKIPELVAPLGVPKTDSSSLESKALTLRSLTERLIRRLYEAARGNCKDLSTGHVEQILRLATESVSGSRVKLPGGVCVERIFESLVFSATETVASSLAYQYEVRLPIDKEAAISVPELGTRFLLKVIDWPSRERDTNLENVLDADLLKGPLTLRNWQSGDAYRPRGHRQLKKLKQLFLTKRVPKSDRALWPLMECGGSIVWARGMPLSGDFCAGQGTRKGLQIEEGTLNGREPVARQKSEYTGFPFASKG